MLQRLLAERFGLVVHRETRQLPGYRVVIAKGGPKLKKSVEAAPTGEGAVVVKNGTPQFSKDSGSGILLTLAGETLRGRHETLAGLQHQLVSALHAPVLDATGIEGEYDYDLTFAPEPTPLPKEATIHLPPGAMGGGGQSPSEPLGNGPHLMSAIKEQLGLQFESVKAVPVDVLVLDSAKREPIEN